MDRQELIFVFKSGAWQKIICAGYLPEYDGKGNLVSIDFDECEGSIIPEYIKCNEVIAILPAAKKSN
jgi:hypothetical protein